MLNFTTFWSHDQNTTKLSRKEMAVEVSFVDDESVLAFISAAEKEIHLEKEFNQASEDVGISVSVIYIIYFSKIIPVTRFFPTVP